MDWLNNPWVVGIGGGILSGLLVTFVSRAIFSRRDRREYAQKCHSANREVIYALRPGISEGHVPDRVIVGALTNATARKYSVDASDLFGAAEVAEELTKEIMDSSFISASTKKKYCDELESLIVPARPSEADMATMKDRSTSDLSASYRARMVTMMSGMLGVMTTLMTMVIVFSDELRLSPIGAKSESLEFLLPATVAMFTAIMAASLTLLRSEVRKKRNRLAEKDMDQESEEQTTNAT